MCEWYETTPLRRLIAITNYLFFSDLTTSTSNPLANCAVSCASLNRAAGTRSHKSQANLASLPRSTIKMTIDTTPGHAQGKTPHPAQAGDDFIPLDDVSDDDFAADSDSETSLHSDTDDTPSFHPHRITRDQFQSLLSCYPTTVEQVHRRKVMLKLQPKPDKGSKRKAEKKAGSASANLRGAALLRKTDFNPSEMKHIAEEVGRFLELDGWRYEGLPGVIAERIREAKNAGDVFLSKEELVTVMEWKT